MRKYIYTLITLLLIPTLVNAETLTYNICKSGCEYSSFEEIRNNTQEISNEVGEEVFSTYDLIINFKDSETYELDNSSLGGINSLTINGNNASIISEEFYIRNTNNVTLDSLNITSGIVQFVGKYDNSMLADSNYDEYKNNIFNINNCKINTELIFFLVGVFNISNSSLNLLQITSALSDVNIQNTSLVSSFMFVGGANIALYDTNVYLNINDLEQNKKIIRCLYNEESIEELVTKYPELNDSNTVLDKYIFIEFPLTEEHINNGITKTNNIFIKQEVSKTIKDNTKLSEFESEFVNTYEDSFGYDDIKDLPIEWKSENEDIAKLENGIIIPVSAGNVDIVGKRGNDIYTIHLTVEKETIPEKIDKMTIKVPITGSKIKAWVVVVSVVLLGVIGTCSCMLIRRKK